MRHHGVKLIANFNLPHLLSSASVWEQDDYVSDIEVSNKTDVDDMISKIGELDNDELELFGQANKKAISSSIRLQQSMAKRKQEIIEG
jgi:hypothetical protein